MNASPQQLLELLVSGNAEHRLHAQRELLRRGDQGNVADRLQQILADRNRPAFARVAAMFTLKQLRGQRSHPAITAVASDPALRAASLRALTDHRGQMAGVSANFIAPFLRDTSAQVRLAAIAALVRLGGTASARDIVPLTADSDPALSHAAVRALVTLNARQSALAAVDSGSMPMIRGALRALQQMHDPMVVTALLSRVRSAPPPASAEITFALARLYHREANWSGDWWGTRPAFAGPYFAPVTWEQSGNIRGALRAALLAQGQSAASLDATVDQFIRNRVLPPGSRALLSRLASANDPRRSEVVDLLVGTFQVSPTAAPLLTALDATGSAMRSAVAELLGAEASLDSAYVPLIRVAALDTTLDAAVRAQLLGQAGRMPGRPGLEVAAELFARANPDSGVAAPIDMAWRRFVGDRRRVQELDYFIEMARAPESSRRTLALSVLLQTIRGNRVQQNVRTRVTPVIDSTWSDRTRAADLVHAIVLMRLESQYADQLAAYRGGGGTGGAGGAGVTQAARPPATGSPDWLQLFNGRDLSDWEIKFAGRPLNENFNNTFRVEEGMLKVRYDQWTGFNGEFGHIFYKQPFSHYIVAVEYRFVGEQVTGAGQSNSWAIRNNGIMLHSQSAASMGERQDFPISLEVQLLGGLGRGPRTTGNLCTPGTHVVRNDRLVTTHCMNSSSQTYDGDQWVRVEAMVLGDSLIRHIVNGDTVFTYSKPQMGGGSANNTNPGVLVSGKPLTEGFISLQAETAPIDFRKVELLNLAGCMDPASPNYRPYFVRSDPTACRPR
jgi:hypothetical protein